VLPVDFVDAVVGAKRCLTLPDGKSLDVAIPPGTEDSQVLRLADKAGPASTAARPAMR
jgi:DnaJ-class molecular chaperone